jgi:hypothetical protein
MKTMTAIWGERCHALTKRILHDCTETMLLMSGTQKMPSPFDKWRHLLLILMTAPEGEYDLNMTADNRCVTAIVGEITSTGIISADSETIDDRAMMKVKCRSSHLLYIVINRQEKVYF